MRYVYPDVTIRKRHGLPHWHVPLGVYFVTFRLAESLPRAVTAAIEAETERWIREAIRERGSIEGGDLRDLERVVFRLTQAELDEARGECWMRDPRVADLILDALRFFDGERYEMIAGSVMPNHVHTVFRLCAGATLDRVIHSWKSFTGTEANRLLGREGPFWEPDYFDVLVRSSEELQRCVRYTLENPLKARLEGWRWTYCGEDSFARLI